MDKFSIGEIVIYVRPGSPYYGEEVVITRGIHRYPVSSDHLGQTAGSMQDGYGIKCSWVTPCAARPEWLRKKKPPSREIDQVTTWDKCAWSPREVEHA